MALPHLFLSVAPVKGWLARLFHEHAPHTRLDLTAPALIAEVVIHVKSDGERMVYASKMEASPEEIVKVVQAVIEAGMDLARQYGIAINMKQG